MAALGVRLESNPQAFVAQSDRLLLLCRSGARRHWSDSLPPISDDQRALFALRLVVAFELDFSQHEFDTSGRAKQEFGEYADLQSDRPAGLAFDFACEHFADIG